MSIYHTCSFVFVVSMIAVCGRGTTSVVMAILAGLEPLRPSYSELVFQSVTISVAGYGTSGTP